MATTIVTVDGEELEIPTCMIEDVSYSLSISVACGSVLQLENYPAVISIQREIFLEVLSLDTWNHVIKEEDRQNLEQLLPKIKAQNHEDVIEYGIVVY